MKLVIDLPNEFEQKLKTLLQALQIPQSEIKRVLTEIVLNDSWTKDCHLWTDGFIYPNQRAAKRAAAGFFTILSRSDQIQLSFLDRGTVREKTFVGLE